jgi:hypothetical protein
MKRKRKLFSISVMPAVLLALVLTFSFVLAGCGGDDATTPSDTRTALTAGSAVSIYADATTANVTFTGAAGLSLAAADFAVTTGGTVSSVSVASGTATVTVTFAANAAATAKTYTVSIATSSSTIKGSAAVAITQAASGGGGDALIAPWYVDQDYTTLIYEFTSGGKILVIGIDTGMTFTASGGKITTSAYGYTAGTADYSITDNALTISNAGSSGLTAGIYYKKSGGSDLTDTRVELIAGGAVDALATATTADVTFTGATGLSLTAADFAVTTGGTVGNVSVSDGTATVTVSFAANTADTAKTYTVSIASGSTTIKGSGTVVITQAAASGGGLTWTTVADSPFGSGSIDINGVAYGGGTFVAVGSYGKIAHSADGGVTWTESSSDPFQINARINDVTYGDGTFVAVATGTGSTGTGSGIGYSTDGGETWARAQNADGTYYDFSNSSVTYGGASGSEKFVAVGVLGITYSTDGVNWTRVTASTFSSLNSVTYGGGKFVAVGGYGKAAYSADGVTWTAVGDTTYGTDYSGTIYTVAYGGTSGSEKFVAMGYNNTAAYSADGVTWAKATDKLFDALGGAPQGNAVAYGGGKFVAGGSGGMTAYSADGVTWTAVSRMHNLFVGRVINGVAYGDGKFVAVGDDTNMAYTE